MTVGEFFAGPLASAALTIAAVIRAVQWGRTRTRVAGATAAILGSLALAAAMNTPGFSDPADRVWPNFGHLASQSTLLVFCGAALLLVSSRGNRPSTGMAVWITAAVLVVHAAVFFAGGRLPPLGRDAVTDAPGISLTLCGLVVAGFALPVGVTMIALVAPNLGWSTPEKRGMTMLTVGLTLMVAYVLVRIIALIGLLAGAHALPVSILSGISAVAAIGLPVVAAGAIYAPLDRGVRALRDLPHARRLYAQHIGPPPRRSIHPPRELDTLLTGLGDELGAGAVMPSDATLRSWVLAHRTTST